MHAGNLKSFQTMFRLCSIDVSYLGGWGETRGESKNTVISIHAIEFILLSAAALVFSRFVKIIPGVVLQIIFGVVIGSAVLGLSGAAPGITLLSDLGLFAIFYEVGLDFDLTAPELTNTTPARSAVAGVSTSFLLVGICALALGYSLHDSVLVGLATVSTSVSVSVYSFLSLGPLVHLEARVAVVAGLFDDLLGLITLAVLSSVLSHSVDGAISLVVSLAVVAASYITQRRIAGRTFELSALRRFGLVAILTFALIVLWHNFGLTLAIAGFVAGAFSGPILSHGDQDVIKRISGFLAPFFLVSLGLLVRFHGGITLGDAAAILVLDLAMVLSKGAAALVMKGQLSDRVLYWFSMAPRAEVAGIGLALIATEVPAQLELAAILAVVLTSLTSPFVILARARKSNPDGGS